MSKYGLTVPPGEDTLGAVRPAPADDSEKPRNGTHRTRTFDFLGLLHYWGRSQRGVWVVKRKTANSRLKRALKARVGMVSKQSARSRSRNSTRSFTQKLRGPLRVLRDYWKLLQPPGIPGGSAKDLARHAVSATPRWRCDVGPVPSSGDAVQSSPRPCGPRPAEQRSEVMR